MSSSANSDTTGTAQIGVTGLAVMGSNIARNFAHHGYTVALHNRSVAKTDALLAEHGSEGTFVRTETMAEFLAALEKPRRVLIMVKAGDPTDAVINELADAIEEGDIIIDGGNALYTDTIRREKAMRERGLHFVGAGISGGEEGALNGPSIMPGGPAESYKSLGPLLEEISAHVDGVPCCTHIGPDGVGPLRQDGAQRHRVLRHAADRRGLPAAARRAGLVRARRSPTCSPSGTRATWTATWSRSPPRCCARPTPRPASRSSTSSSTRPSRRAPAAGR